MGVEEKYLKYCPFKRMWSAYLYKAGQENSAHGDIFQHFHRGNISRRPKLPGHTFSWIIHNDKKGYILHLRDGKNKGASIRWMKGGAETNSQRFLTILMSRFNILLGAKKLKILENVHLFHRCLQDTLRSRRNFSKYLLQRALSEDLVHLMS